MSATPLFAAMLAWPLIVATPFQDMADIEIKSTRLADGVFMLEGQGGNMALSVGDDGSFLVDDQFAPLTGRIIDAVAAVSEHPVRFVINTHWHGDHTGGNENLGKAGAIIVAHENVRARMSTDQFMKAFNREVPASPAAALPVVTFTDEVTFHWNADDIRVMHVAPAHTDGDSLVHFKSANVLHMGDTFFNGMYPFIDTSTHGSLAGMIAAVERGRKLANGTTKIIPGHGPLAKPADLDRYLEMLRTVQSRVTALMASGHDRQAIVDAKPTRDLDADWGKGFMSPDQFVGIVVDGMRARNHEAAPAGGR